jgi:homoserine O-succinyltransferase
MALHIEPPGILTARSAADSGQGGLVIGLINNMPDAALEATEAQFSRLLRLASGARTVRLRIGYLPEVPRAPEVAARIARDYWHVDRLLAGSVDALIVTGLEPKAANLVDEPYWGRFVELLRWARVHTASSIWSCLAAHGAVQHLDGVLRRRLAEKRFGVFEHTVRADHALMADVASPLAIPHSRWNELPASELRSAGYTLLSHGPQTGADIFVKETESLLVFLQGHPEYEPTTLLKEYRRDVGRYVRGQQSHYPAPPHGYFTTATIERLRAFEEQARARRAEETLALFPSLDENAYTGDRWGPGAVQIYRNWLALIAKARAPVAVAS